MSPDGEAWVSRLNGQSIAYNTERWKNTYYRKKNMDRAKFC